jgi:hypothetical protein
MQTEKFFSCLLSSIFCHIFKQTSPTKKVGPKTERVLFLVPFGLDLGRMFLGLCCVEFGDKCAIFCGLLVLFCEQGNEATDSVVRGRQYKLSLYDTLTVQ